MRYEAAASSILEPLAAIFEVLSPNKAGIRLHGLASLNPLLEFPSAIGSIAASHLNSGCRPVRAILFDKSAGNNWALGWHQDRTIAVQQKVEFDGFSSWNVKSGMAHVEPPFAIIENLITLRIHLDPVPMTNAPLLIAPGSHHFGRIVDAEIEGVVSRCGIMACVAERGDVWAYSTPILHASAASFDSKRRRVLQVDYSSEDLPGDLQWLGI